MKAQSTFFCFTMNWRKSRERLIGGQFLGMILHIPSLCHASCNCSPETTPTNQSWLDGYECNAPLLERNWSLLYSKQKICRLILWTRTYIFVAFFFMKVSDDGLILSTQICFLKGADVQLPTPISQDLLKQDAEAKKMEAEAVKLTQQVEQSQEKVQVLHEEVQDRNDSTKNRWVGGRSRYFARLKGASQLRIAYIVCHERNSMGPKPYQSWHVLLRFAIYFHRKRRWKCNRKKRRWKKSLQRLQVFHLQTPDLECCEASAKNKHLSSNGQRGLKGQGSLNFHICQVMPGVLVHANALGRLHKGGLRGKVVWKLLSCSNL